MNRHEDDTRDEPSAHEEIVGRDTPEGREQLQDALKGLRDLAAENAAQDAGSRDWRISDEERDTGKKAVEEAREVLRRTESPTIRLAREKKIRDAQENDPK